MDILLIGDGYRLGRCYENDEPKNSALCEFVFLQFDFFVDSSIRGRCCSIDNDHRRKRKITQTKTVSVKKGLKNVIEEQSRRFLSNLHLTYLKEG